MQQTQRDEKTVKEILEAARIIFSHYGLKKSTMDDVAKAIGKGKSTLYYYYPGKNELFEAVVADELQKLIRITRLAMNSANTSRDKLKALLLKRLELSKHMHNLGQVIKQDIFDNFEKICSLKRQFEQTQVEFIKEIILGGVQAGEFKKMSPEEISFFSNWVIAGFNGLLLPTTSECLIESDEAAEKVIQLILYGIGN